MPIDLSTGFIERKSFMQSLDYSKYKDRSSQDTIFAVQKTLNDAGLFPVTKWVEDSAYVGVHSNRVSLYPSSCGTNGKKHGFFDSPDEKHVDIAEFVAEKNFVIQPIMEKFNFRSEHLQREFFSFISKNFYDLTDETIPVIPFADLNSGKIQWLPSFFNLVIYGSNGMAAGNTLEEAFVQGLSEIFERYASEMILSGKAVPPRIPDEYLQPYNLWNLVEQIRENGKYDVAFYDCSLGKGYPVVGCIICDRKNGQFGMKLGSHPSFVVAAERSLTEAMQGRAKIDSFVSLCHASALEEATSFHNIPNVAKVGLGTYPTKMFIDKPDWEFKEWTDWKNAENKSFLKRMIKLLADDGYTILLRDASHLGFPACQIIIPQMSEIYQIAPIWARTIFTALKVTKDVPHFPKLTAEKEELLLRLIRFKEGSIIENKFNAVLTFPVRGKRMDSDFVGGFLAFKQDKFELAIHFFNKLYQIETDETEKIILAARIEYLRYRLIGHNHEDAGRLIRRFFLENVAEHVIIYTALRNGKKVSQESLIAYLKEFV